MCESLMFPLKLNNRKDRSSRPRHSVKVGPGPRDPEPWDPGPGTQDPPHSLKVGPQNPLQNLKVGSQDPLQSLKVEPPHLSLMNSFFSEYLIVFYLF